MAARVRRPSGFFTSPVNVTRFANQFSFQLINPNADGFTFAIQGTGANALGQAGGWLGYGPSTAGGIAKSVAVKFDLYNNQSGASNSTGLMVNGAPLVPAQSTWANRASTCTAATSSTCR